MIEKIDKNFATLFVLTKKNLGSDIEKIFATLSFFFTDNQYREK